MPTILGANSDTRIFPIDNSLRFNDGDSPDLKRLPSATGQSIKGSLSVWVKFSNDNTEVAILGGFDNSGADDNDGYLVVKRIAAGNLEFAGRDTVWLKTTQLLRDTSAWYHIVLGIDTSLATADDRQKLYINGVQVTSFATRNNATRFQDFPMNTTAGNDDALLIGADEDTGGKGLFFDGYMADFYWIDQGQKEASDFGEFNDDGVWVPTAYTGAFGVNGVHLEFKGTGTSADSSGIGADTSGNDLHFTVTNLTALDVTTDTCTNNFCTLNYLDKDTTIPTLAEGNLDYHSINGTQFNPVRSTFAVTKGKWYAEWKYINTAGFLGVISTQSPLTGNIASDADVRSILRIPAGLYAGRNNSGGFTDVGDNSQTFSDNDIGQVALDMDNGFVYFGINGTYLKGQDGSTTGDPAGNNGGAGGSANHPSQLMTAQHDGVIAFMAGDFTQNTTGQIQCNFGNPPYAISSGNADADGHGNFEFAVPSGFFALCTKNLGKYG